MPQLEISDGECYQSNEATDIEELPKDIFLRRMIHCAANTGKIWSDIVLVHCNEKCRQESEDGQHAQRKRQQCKIAGA